MKRFKGFLALLLCIVMTVTLIPAFGETKTKADELPEGLENATLVADDLYVEMNLTAYDAMNMKIGDFLNRVFEDEEGNVPSNFKAYKIIEGFGFEDAYPVVFADTDNILQLTDGGVNGWEYDINTEDYLSFADGYCNIEKIALVFGDNNNTITSDDKVYIVEIGFCETPYFNCSIYSPSGDEMPVCAFGHEDEFEDGNCFVFLVPFDWMESSEANVVLGFMGYDSDGSKGLSTTIYSGYYETEADIPSDAEDITSDVWRGNDTTTKKKGLSITGYDLVPITIVLKRNDKVVDVLARYVEIRQQETSLGTSQIYVDTSKKPIDSDCYVDYTVINGYEILTNVLIPYPENSGYEEYLLHLRAEKGKYEDTGTEYVEKAVQGVYSSLEEANAANAKDLKDQLFGTADTSNGFVIEPDEDYVFTVFFKDGGCVQRVVRLEMPEIDELTITKEPESVIVKEKAMAYFSVTAIGDGLQYLWQYKEAGSSEWIDWNTKTTPDISVAYKASRNGMRLRCVITDSQGYEITSREVVLRYSNVTINSVTINETNFPDVIFRDFVTENLDNDWNGILSPAELMDITSIYFEDDEVASLKGIELFPNLEYICCYNCGLKNIDISKNPNLCYLEIDGNTISTIDISNNPLLKEVYLKENGQIKDYNGYNYITFGDAEGENENEERAFLSIPLNVTVVLGGTGNAAIVRQPENIEVVQDKLAYFAVAATGKGLKYQWQYMNLGDSSWTTWSGKTKSLISVAYSASRQGTSFRCIVTDANGNKVISNPAVLTYTLPLSITSDPVSVTVTEGEAATFSVRTAGGTGIQYLWQYKLVGQDDWIDWTSKTTPTISVAYAAYRDGMSLRCVVTDATGGELFSKEAVLTYKKAITITKQPADTSVDPGKAADFSITATGDGLTYLWQYKNVGDSAWTDWTSKTSPVINVAYAAYRNGMSLRCVIKDSKGNTVTSNVATLKYNSSLKITQHPADTSVNEGELASMEVKASGSGLKYLWQYQEKDGTTWTDWNAKKTAKISIAYAAYRQGMKFRCVVKDSSGNTVTSNAATLTYLSPFSITQQPENTVVNTGELAFFEVKAIGKGLKYLWQYQEKGKTTWTDWNNKTSPKISVAYAAYRNGMSFRCVVTDANGTVLNSDPATLTYVTPLAITQQPVNATVNDGAIASFSVKATGSGLKYQWQYKLAGDSSWTTWSSKTKADITVAYAAYRDGMSLQCIITDASGAQLTTDTVTLNYSKDLIVTEQ
ncbi:MAG: hypothetical protein K6E47_00250 [Lachnospiraceae bacterium]|nr:hypothetical protein [Lachnospiraceae bacterium]